VWKRTVAGRILHFYLAGINNQNFLMRDNETGTWWQQVTGKAIFGPLRGSTLEWIANDELTFALWKTESPAGQVLVPVSSDLKNYESNWEPKVSKLPVVISFKESGLADRDVVVGLEIRNTLRAYPMKALSPESPIEDRVAGIPILLAVGPDGKSVRGFVRQVNGSETDFFRKSESREWTLMDSYTGSDWNFQGCSIRGAAVGICLERIAILKDYWFDWRNYHPTTSVYRH